MAIEVPDLKTTYQATKATNRDYPIDWDADNTKIISAFASVDSALEAVLSSQGIQFVADYLRRLDTSDPISFRVGGDCLQILTPGLAASGSFTLSGNNADSIQVAYIAGKRRQHIGDFVGTLADLITSGEITDQGGGAWSGEVFIGVEGLADTDLALVFSTDSLNVQCPIHVLDVSVTGIGSSPSFSATRYRLFAGGRETVWSGTDRTLRNEMPVVFSRDFKAEDTAREAVIYVPFLHVIQQAYLYVEEDGVAYAGSFQIERINPSPITNLFASAVNFAGGNTQEGPATFQPGTLVTGFQDAPQRGAAFYRIHHPSLATPPTRWSVGILARPITGGFAP